MKRFTRKMRMVKKRDFSRAYREGSRARGDFLTVVVVANGLEETRLGLSVGRRVQRKAVRRNRVRRLFRESFRLRREELPAGLDVVMIAHLPGLDPDLESTCRDLARLTRKAHKRYLERVEKQAAGEPV